MTDTTHHVIDSGAIAVLFATFFGYLPHITALLTFVWVLIRLYETRTVSGALKRLFKWLSR